MSKHGDRNPNSRLTSSDVTQIVVFADGGRSQKSLAAEFGVTQGAISMILTGRTWSELTGIVYEQDESHWYNKRRW